MARQERILPVASQRRVLPTVDFRSQVGGGAGRIGSILAAILGGEGGISGLGGGRTVAKKKKDDSGSQIGSIIGMIIGNMIAPGVGGAIGGQIGGQIGGSL